MHVPLSLQYMIIAIAVMLSFWAVLNQKMPGTLRGLRNVLALACLREGRAPWLARIGRRLAPAVNSYESACGGCSGCGPGKQA